MLYFSKIKIITVIFVTLVFTYLTFSNLFKFDDNYVKNKINLGLDLQGGSYLLLEIDNQPIISQTLQNKLIDLKKIVKTHIVDVLVHYVTSILKANGIHGNTSGSKTKQKTGDVARAIKRDDRLDSPEVQGAMDQSRYAQERMEQQLNSAQELVRGSLLQV